VAGCLNRWAWNGSKRTENTAVTRLWFQNSMAVFTFVKKLACVFGHNFRFLITAGRAGYDRLKNQLFHHYKIDFQWYDGTHMFVILLPLLFVFLKHVGFIVQVFYILLVKSRYVY